VFREGQSLGVLLAQPPPYNLPYYYANLVITAPTEANALAADRALSIQYYFFQAPFGDPQIQAFSLLPYFSLVYSNPQIFVFEFTGGTPLGFIPAVAYCSASPGIVPVYKYNAYSAANGVPAMPNSVSSSAGNGPVGLNVSYCLNVPAAGNYTIDAHRIIFQPTEYLEVGVNGHAVGTIRFSSLGPALGTPLATTLPAGNVTLTFTFAGTVRYVGPMDYVVVAPS
jgi:hypothetical protein